MKSIKTIEDAQIAIRDIENRLKQFEVGNINLAKRRIINAGESVDKNDYIIRLEGEATMKILQDQITQLVQEVTFLKNRVKKLENP